MRTLAFFLSLVVVFTIPWEGAIVVGDLGTLTRVIGMVAAAVWLCSALVAHRFRKPHPFHLAILLFILWNIVSVFWSVGVDETVQRIKTYAQLTILIWVLWDLYTTPEALTAALEAYVLGAYVAIGSTIFNYLVGHQISSSYEARYTGAGLNAVELALILTLGLPVAWHLATSASHGIKNHILKLANYAYIPASLYAITLTASRMPLFAAVPAILYIFGTANRIKPFYRVLILAAFVGTLPFIPLSSIERLATTGSSLSTGDLGGRGGLWYASIAVFSEHPLMGVGSGTLGTDSLLGTVAHNTFLSVLAELGLIGFVLFLAMLTIVAVQAVNQPKWVSGLWLTVLVIWAIGSFTLTWEYSKTTWLMLNLIVISSNLFRGDDHVVKDLVSSDASIL